MIPSIRPVALVARSKFAHLSPPSIPSSLSSSLYQLNRPAQPRIPVSGVRAMSATAPRPDPFRPAKRVAGQRQDVWCVRIFPGALTRCVF
jgi:hypothetical protein